MAEIDSLEISIQGKVDSAARSIDILVEKLNSIPRALSRISAIPVKLNFDTSGLDSGKMEYAVKKAFENTKFDTLNIGKKLADEFNVAGKQASENISKQFQDIFKEATDSLDGSEIKVKIPRSFIDSIAESGNIAKSDISQSLDGIKEEYQSFYDYFKSHKIYISDFLKNDIGKTEFNDLLERNLSNITRDKSKGIDLNENWSELTERYPSLISEETVNAADQVLVVLQKINEAREQIKPVSIQSLFGEDYESAIKNIKDSVFMAASEVKEKLLDNANSIYNDTANSGAIINIDINEDAIVTQIQSAIRKASSIKFEPIKIDFNVDISKIKLDLSKKLKEINLSELSESLAQFKNISIDATQLNNLADSISKFGRKIAKSGIENIENVAKYISELTNAIAEIPDFSSGAEQISKIAEAIKILGYKSSEKAISNLPKFTEEIEKLMNALSKAPNIKQSVIDMTNALADLAKTGVKEIKISDSMSKSFDGVSSSGSRASRVISGTGISLRKLIRSIIPFISAWQLINFGKKAIEISSDLTEVQNVVDVSFGKMAYKVEDFARTSIEQFGLSELALKQYSSRFQAMGTAMQITPSLIENANNNLFKMTDGYVSASDSMSDMSLNLTKLTADMASFYNVEQDVVAEKLASVFTGQTRPLRDFGLDLTQATLQEWALKNGIDANIQSMSQAEKTMLRYQYVMANTKAVHGDFARTSGSWANQVRILSQNFQQLAGIVGGVLVNAFKPVISAANAAMGAIITFAKVISNALGAIFGWTYEEGGGGIAQDFGGAAEAADNLAGSTGKAADNVEKIKKGIRSFDELKTIELPEPSSGGGGGGGGGGGAGGSGEAGGGWVKGESILKNFESEIGSLYDLGKYIGNKLTEAMNSINWDSVYEKARNFGTGLAEFLNGLISPELFGAVGTSIAGALNTALNFLDSFGETFNWVNFGNSIAAGINNFFSTFDFDLLAHTINTWADGLLDFVIEMLRKVEWDDIGTKIGEFLDDINFLEVGAKVGTALWEALNAGIEFYKGMFTAAPVETAIITALASTRFFSKITPYLKNTGNTITSILSASISHGINVMKIGGGMGQPFSGLVAGVKNAVNMIEYELGKLSTGMKLTIGAGTMLGEFALIRNGISDLLTGPDSFGELVVSIGEIGIAAVAAKTILTGVFGAAGPIVAAITGVAAAFSGINAAMDEMAENSAIGQFSTALGELSDSVSRETDSIKERLDKTREGIESAGVAEAVMARDLAGEYEILSGKIQLSSDEKQRMADISGRLTELIPGLNGYIDEQTGYLDIQNDTLKGLIDNYELYAKKQALQEAITETYKTQVDAQKNLNKAEGEYNAIAKEFINNTEGMSDTVKTLILEGDIQKLKDYRDEITQNGATFGRLTSEFGKSATNIGSVNKMIDLLDESTKEYRVSMEDARGALEETKGDLTEYNEMLSNTNSEIEENKDLILENKKASAEFQQTVSDLKNEFSGFGSSISQEFAEILALDKMDGGNMAETIKNVFEKMKSQTQLSSGELKTLFHTFGTEMPDEFTDALSQKEPEVQSSISSIFANMSAGVKPSAEELKQVFSAIGTELPDETIKELKGKEIHIQQSVVGLLSKIESGKELVEPNLLQLFSELGWKVPDELTKSIASKDADVQKAAIETIGVLEEAAKEKGVDVETIYSAFGTDTINELINSVNGLDEETKQTALDLIGQMMVAADDQRGPIAEKLKELGIEFDESFISGISDSTKMGELDREAKKLPETAHNGANDQNLINEMADVGRNVLQGFINGLSDNVLLKEVANRGAEMLNIAKKAAEGAGEIKSPSRVFKRIGGFTTEGFNIGLKNNMGQTYSIITGWYEKISSFKPPEFKAYKTADLIPKMDFAQNRSFDAELGNAEATLKADINASMASRDNELRQQNQLLREQNELLRMIYEKPALSDDTVFNSARRGQHKYQSRTWKTGWAGVD